MRNLVVGILVLIVVVLMFQVHTQSTALKALQESAPPKIPSLELQEKCARQAAVEFRQEGLENKPFAEFSNHYSVKLGRCFVVTKNTESTANAISNQRTLSDAYEGKVYGTYLWVNNQGKKFWEVDPIDCNMTLPSGERKVCKTDNEWEELAKAYTEAQ